jgi:sugar fermentation stimulation protein A
MKFKEGLLQGTLVKRYKRFFVDIKYNGKIITSHCPNSGSMMGLLDNGNKVWFSESDNPNRKLKYTLEIIEIKKKMVGINTLLTNKIVLEALNSKKINSLKKFNIIKAESKFSNNTRFDFLLINNKEKCFLEVKNVSLVREKKNS